MCLTDCGYSCTCSPKGITRNCLYVWKADWYDYALVDCDTELRSNIFVMAFKDELSPK